MRLILNKNQLNQAPENLLRQAGYAYITDRRTGQDSFTHPLGRGFYPRFHLYLEERDSRISFNLHLDQKQASYQGASAHNAEYDGEVVEAEMVRLKELITHNSQPITQNTDAESSRDDILDKIRPKQFNLESKKEEKSWWRRIFE